MCVREREREIERERNREIMCDHPRYMEKGQSGANKLSNSSAKLRFIWGIYEY